MLCVVFKQNQISLNILVLYNTSFIFISQFSRPGCCISSLFLLFKVPSKKHSEICPALVIPQSYPAPGKRVRGG